MLKYILEKNSQLTLLNLLLAKVFLMLGMLIYLVAIPQSLVLWIGLGYATLFLVNAVIGLAVMIGLVKEHFFHYQCHNTLKLCGI